MISAALRRLALAAATAIVACGPPPAEPPAPSALTTAAEPLRTAARVAVAPAATGTAVAAAFVVPGSAWEGGAEAGLTLLAARAALEDAREALDELGARAAVSCDRAAFTFTLVAPTETWPAALDRFTASIFRADPTEAALERARAALTASLRLDQASPAWQARLAPRRALHDDGTGDPPWARPACGVPEILAGLRLPDVRRATTRFRPAEATAAVVGPVVADSILAALRTDLGTAPPARFPAPQATGPGRVYVERNTVTAWLSVAWPFGPHADLDAVHLLGAILQDGAAPAVDRPEIFHSGYAVERHGRGGALIVHVVLEPRYAGPIARDLEAQAARAAAGGVHPAVLDRVRRRHHGERLIALGTPEARAARLARALAFGGEAAAAAGPLTEWPDPRGVTAERVRRAASQLGAPARAVVGPRSARPAVVP